jgi:hypothetical protein
MDFMLLLVAAGPALSAVGHYLEWPVVFWLGVLVAAGNLWMDVASEVMKFPIIPIALVVGGAIMLAPWWYGAAVGLLVWTALDAAGILLGRR